MIGTDPINYEAVLQDLLTKKAALYKAIAGVCMILGKEIPSLPAAADGPSPQEGDKGSGNIPEHAFFQMNALEAIKKLLALKKTPMSAKDIETCLLTGGFTSASKNVYSTVYTALKRSDDGSEGVIKINGNKWGLADWFPGRRQKPKSGGKDSSSTDEEPVVVVDNDEP